MRGLREHMVVPGDNLMTIACKYYNGDWRHWREIYLHNDQIIEDPNHVYVGQVLAIPHLIRV